MSARRSLGAVAGPSAPAAPPAVELHPITKRLRKMWKFAAVCQFLFVFDEAFGMSGFETETLETDFENNESSVVPDLIKRLLYTLTLDRTIDLDNWQHHLRTQYNLRDEDSNSRFGTAEQPVKWAQLSLEDKIATLHDLCEWQLMDPERFRKLVKSEEDITTWRVSPIGWDAHDNAYWLFDDNRIWIQRPQPVPKAKAPAKSRAPAKKGTKRARMEAAAARRAATTAVKPSPAAKSAGTKRGRPSDVTPSSTPSKRTRSSLADSAASTPSRPPPRRGTRTSARFAPQEEEITTSSNGRASRSAAAGYSSDSELSEPPETLDDEDDAKPDNADDDVKMENGEAEDAIEAEGEEEEAQQEQEDEKEATEEDEWVEFEAIVVTRQEWLDFAKRFAKSKDPNEKNLHQFINDEILDQVLAAMDEIERQRAMEQALANRKRSSRIAMKESEREERERDREARARMEEKMAAIRKEEEQKKQKEEQEAQRSRADRLREREERLRARELEIETRAVREEEERERREREREERKRRREEIIANGGVPPPSKDSTPIPEDGDAYGQGDAMEEEEEEWELNCEVCGKNAISPPDEDNEIVCCEECGVWQHIKCWNSFDKQVVGLKKRDWDTVDFFCTKCRPPAAGTPVPHPGILSRSNKSSPRGNKRASNGPESPTRKADAAAAGNGDSPRQRIKLVSGSKNAEATKAVETATQNAPADVAGNGLVKPPTIPSQTLRPPTAGALPAETGLLTSSGAATRPSPATAQVGQLPPPSSHAVPTAAGTIPTLDRPLLPSHNVGSNAVGDPSKVDATTANKATNGIGGNGSTHSGTGLGMGRPSPTPQFSAMGSPRSPSSGGASSPGTSGLGNGAGAISPRSPSYGATLGSPGFRRPSQPSGSFPMRHTPAKSPLSRPYESPLQNGDPANNFSLGPPRAASPSANRGAGGFASLAATAKSLHPLSAATIPAEIAGPAQAHALGNVAGGAFAQAFSEAPIIEPKAAASSPEAAPASELTALSSPVRPQLSSTESDGANGQKHEPRVDDFAAAGNGASSGSPGSDADAKKPSSAAANAFHLLEHGLSTSPTPGEKTKKAEGSSAPEVNVVELPPTHIQSS